MGRSLYLDYVVTRRSRQVRSKSAMETDEPTIASSCPVTPYR